MSAALQAAPRVRARQGHKTVCPMAAVTVHVCGRNEALWSVGVSCASYAERGDGGGHVGRSGVAGVALWFRPPWRPSSSVCSRRSMRRSTTMAEGRRMTAVDVVAGVLAGEHGDFVREAVALVAREIMEAEI